MASKAEQRAVALVALPVLSGSVACAAQPGLKFLKVLRDRGACTAVVSLGTSELGGICSELGLTCVQVGLKGANIRILTTVKMQKTMSEGVVRARDLLLAGEKLLVHSLNEVYGTGLFVYVLLRVCGLTKEESTGRLRSLIQGSEEKFNDSRLEIAEMFVGVFEGTGHVAVGEGNNEVVTPEEKPLLWIKIAVNTHCVRITCLISDSTLGKIVPGIELWAMNPGVAASIGQFRALESPGETTRTIGDAERILYQYLASSTKKGSCKISGTNSHIERQMIMKHFQSVYKHLFYRIIEVNSILHCLNLPLANPETPLEDLKLLETLRETHFKK